MNTIRVKVGAFITAPRYCNVQAWHGIETVLHKCGIPLTLSGGVYYGQCMQIMLSDAIAKGVELAITVDFDSVFTADDVEQLISTAMLNPHIDAVAALQSRRGKPSPLFSNRKFERVAMGDGPAKVFAAHFGLTAIKLDRLKDLPKPWFISKPNENGDWDGDKLDDDVYFWDNWERHGRSLYVDGCANIGHMEDMISCFDETGQHVSMYPAAWTEKRVAEREQVPNG